ncbi:hypothetical protein BDN72DRAFT_831745 [Pluteus cervinus]|uniref:Uncharacterized protein n=1 Tax=Pluteus cervinus TaxID=181527 RepID=A0ACD3BCC7_9AGAR|nr:hypothetical protein BDN72DRAFT_831745 [Pluteus cervinus]
MPYYAIANFLQTSEYTYLCRTPLAFWANGREEFLQMSSERQIPNFRERLRRWIVVCWKREHVERLVKSISAVVLLVLTITAWWTLTPSPTSAPRTCTTACPLRMPP